LVPVKTTVVRVRIPRLPGVFIGVGDLFTSLSTAWLFNTGGDLRLAMEKSASSVQAVLTRTLEHAHSGSAADAQLELELIQADIEDPPLTVLAEVLTEEQKEEGKESPDKETTDKKTTEKKTTEKKTTDEKRTDKKTTDRKTTDEKTTS
jgi:hypothetical protein